MKFFFVQNGWIQDGQIQDGCHHQVEWEWMNEVFFCSKWLNPRWQNSRWLTSSNWVRMNEFESDWISLSQSFVQNGFIQDGRIQDGCHHQINQTELVWIRSECSESVIEWIWEKITRCLNPRWQCLNPWPGRIQDGCHHPSWVRMNEFESDWISLSQSFVQNGWIQDGRIQDGCHHEVN